MDTALKKQVPINLAVNLISFACNVGVGLLLVPYLVKYIGIAAYSLVPLALIFSQYVGLVIQSLNSAVNRYLIIALQKEDKAEAVSIFNSSLVTLTLLTVIQIPILICCLWDLGSLFSVPKGLEEDAIILFSCSFAGYLISIISSIFSVSMYSQNRLDLMRGIEIVRTLSRVAIIVIGFNFSEPSLEWVGIGSLVSALLAFVLTLYFWRRLTPELKIRVSTFQVSHVKSITSMGGWMVANQIGFLLFMRTDIWLISKFIDASKAGSYAAIQQWATLLRTVGGVLAGVVSPVVALAYAKNDHKRMQLLVTSSVGLLMLCMAHCISVLCVFSKEILVVWLGELYGEYSSILVLQIIHLVFNIAVLPLLSLLTVMDSVKWPGVATATLGLVNLIAGYFILNFTSLGIWGVAFISAMTLTLKNTVFLPVYSYRKMSQPVSKFYKKAFSVTCYFAGCTLIASLVKFVFQPTNLINTLAAVAVSLLCCLPLFVVWLVKSDEFFWIKKYLPKKWASKFD